MDPMLFNKLAGATLAALLVIVGARVAVDELYPTGKIPGNGVAAVESSTQVAATPSQPATSEPESEAADPEPSLAILLASADPTAGESAARACRACHVFDEGNANRVGPGLYGIVGRAIAAAEGYNYSNALKEMGGEWSYAALDGFLENPREWAPGNKMSYPGIKDAKNRADLIAYLASLGDAPPFPEPEDEADAQPEEAEEERAQAGQ
jgi:cytochrome c